MLKARLQPWLEEAYQVMNFIQDKLKGLQETQQMMRLVVEGPANEKLIEEVQKVVTQSTVEVVVIQVGLGDLCSEIVVPSE